MARSSVHACVVAMWLIGCTANEADAEPRGLLDAQQPAKPSVEQAEPPAEPDPPDAAESEPEPEPEPPSFDPLTAAGARVRIVAVPEPQYWSACGIIHSVGAIEVEVLEVGEPPPRMLLYVSCPADLGRRVLLEVGKVVDVTLHARRQGWPRPPVEIPEGVPVRYVKTIVPAVSAPTPR